MSVKGKYTSLSTVKIPGLDTNWRPLESNMRFFKAQKVILYTILLGVGGSIFTSHTLNHLKELKPRNTNNPY